MGPPPGQYNHVGMYGDIDNNKKVAENMGLAEEIRKYVHYPDKLQLVSPP